MNFISRLDTDTKNYLAPVLKKKFALASLSANIFPKEFRVVGEIIYLVNMVFVLVVPFYRIRSWVQNDTVAGSADRIRNLESFLVQKS